MKPSDDDLTRLLADVRACTICAAHLPHGPRPVVQADARARILIAGQAPGRRVHRSGLAFDDASGVRLRHWMGMEEPVFRDPSFVALVPMGFCYPGTGKSGDLPPRPECARTWRTPLLAQLPNIELMLLIGQYAQAWHLQQPTKAPLTQTVRAWREHWPLVLPLPHPSPRNNLWLRRNPWFEEEVVPALRERIATLQRSRALSRSSRD
jgi:uracil-DNA glycosylase